MAAPLGGSRLYAILDVDAVRARGLTPEAVLDAWLQAGVRLVQLRAKSLTAGPMLALAETLVARSRLAGASLIVNDRADVARMAGAAGLHVGQSDLAPPEARAIVGDTAILGLSTHSLPQARDATREPIDYVAIGPVFHTTTKRTADPEIGLDGLRHVAASTKTSGLPVVAIGGISLEAAPAVIAAGADVVAVATGLLDDDPESRARGFLEALG